MATSYQNLSQIKSLNGLVIKVAAAALLVAGLVIGTVSAAPNKNKTYSATVNGNKLQCFSGTNIYGGFCEIVNGKTVSIDTTEDGNMGSYGGVYIENSNLGGKLLSDVNKLSFSYEGTGASGGSPRFSIPIDEDNDGKYEAFAFADSTGCTDGTAEKGTVDVINDATCTVTYGEDTYENWAEFVVANPEYRIAKDAITFVIVDSADSKFSLSNVQLGKGPAKPAVKR